jgi:hypothetical protein
MGSSSKSPSAASPATPSSTRACLHGPPERLLENIRLSERTITADHSLTADNVTGFGVKDCAFHKTA